MGKINVLLFTKDERYCAKISDWFARFCGGEFSFVAANSCEFADKIVVTADSVVLVGEEFADDIVLPKGAVAARLVSGNGVVREDGQYSFCKYQSGENLRAAILAFQKHVLTAQSIATDPPPATEAQLQPAATAEAATPPAATEAQSQPPTPAEAATPPTATEAQPQPPTPAEAAAPSTVTEAQLQPAAPAEVTAPPAATEAQSQPPTPAEAATPPAATEAQSQPPTPAEAANPPTTTEAQPQPPATEAVQELTTNQPTGLPDALSQAPAPEIIVVTAVSGGAGATTCALALAKRNAKAGVKTLFLSFDYFGGLSRIFTGDRDTADTGETQGLSSLINAVESGGQAAYAAAKSLIQTDPAGVMYVREVATPAQFAEIPESGAALALESLVATGAEFGADCVVIDVPYLNREFWKISADSADTIIAVSEKNVYSDDKFSRFAETVATDDILRNTDNARKIKHLRNKVTAGVTLLTNIVGKEDGTPEISKIVGAYGDFAAIADIMSASGVWERLVPQD
ncbi:hypothetical protein FACS1894133_2020 [Clostridia bacterium]|nr:hypothetical protein FACS1894133_2020 [Clostridia bacterium]